MFVIKGIESMQDGINYESDIGKLMKSSLPDGCVSLLWQIEGKGDITIMYAPSGEGKIVGGEELFFVVFEEIQRSLQKTHYEDNRYN